MVLKEIYTHPPTLHSAPRNNFKKECLGASSQIHFWGKKKKNQIPVEFKEINLGLYCRTLGYLLLLTKRAWKSWTGLEIIMIFETGQYRNMSAELSSEKNIEVI